MSSLTIPNILFGQCVIPSKKAWMIWFLKLSSRGYAAYHHFALRLREPLIGDPEDIHLDTRGDEGHFRLFLCSEIPWCATRLRPRRSRPKIPEQHSLRRNSRAALAPVKALHFDPGLVHVGGGLCRRTR